MADTKTEDDDDEGFGDFTFAPFAFSRSINFGSNSEQINGLKSISNVATTENNEDDEWGDFVESPVTSNGPSDTQPPLHPSDSSLKSFDPLGFFSDQSVKPSQFVEYRVESEAKKQTESHQSRVQWVKPKGALPLSIFGDVEEEESCARDPEVGNGEDTFDGKNVVSNARSGSNVNTGIGFDDIIASLYNQSRQIKDESRLNSNSSGSKSNSINSASDLNAFDLNSHPATGRKDSDIVACLQENGFNLHCNGVDSDMKASNLSFTELSLDFKELNSNSNGLPSNSNKQSSNLDGLSLDLNGLHSSSNVRNLNSNEQNWRVDGLNLDSSKNISGSNGLDLNVKAPNSNFHGLNLYFNSTRLDTSANTESSNLGGLDLDFNESSSNLQSVGGYKLDANDDDEDDDDGWEFKDAYSETKVGDRNDKGHDTLGVAGFEIPWTRSPETQVDGTGHEISGVTMFSSGFGRSSHGSIDLFATSNEFLSKSHESDFGFDPKPDTIAQNIPISNSYFRNELKDTEKVMNLHPVDNFADFDESFGNFEAASSENELKQGEEPKVNGLSHSEVEEPKFDVKNQGNGRGSENHRGALPLSIFGDEELEADGSLTFQDVSMFELTSYPQNLRSQGSNVSINDLISNLYSQAEQSSHASFAQKPTENGLDSVDSAFESDLVNGDGDFDDGSWEFKDAVSQTKAENQIPILSHGEADKKFSKLKLNNYVDYYSKLKDELCFVVRFHLDGLKKARNNASLSGEDTNVAVLDEEIQKFWKELQQENIVFEEGQLEEHPSRDICLNEFLEVLHGQQFQLLETEYHLSRSIALAEKDLRSAVDLIKHATTMLRILNLVSVEEQSKYVSTWSKMILVCSQELKHGAWFWKQSLERNIQSQILSEPQGKRFVLALGEIYRVVVVLGVSAKLYRPWILSSSGGSACIYALLEECHAHWSTSGLEKALSSLSDPKDSECNICVEMLMDSIKYIRDLDALTLENLIFNQQESICRLSVLTEGVVPGMKMAVWNNEHYFLALANLWANLISSDPPELPQLHAVS